MVRRKLTDDDYRQLLALRTGLRRFLHWSEEQAHETGLTPAQHQLLLAVRGHEDPRGPTIGDVAHYLLLRHHSAVELVQRSVGSGLLVRLPDPDDGRVVRLGLTDRSREALDRLSALHIEELGRLMDHLHPLWSGLDDGGTADSGPAPPRGRQ